MKDQPNGTEAEDTIVADSVLATESDVTPADQSEAHNVNAPVENQSSTWLTALGTAVFVVLGALVFLPGFYLVMFGMAMSGGIPISIFTWTIYLVLWLAGLVYSIRLLHGGRPHDAMSASGGIFVIGLLNVVLSIPLSFLAI